MHTDAMSASDTSTSALMSNSVTRPMMASRMMGTPHSRMAIHAISNGSGWMPARLSTTAIPESTSRVRSFWMPPHSSRCSSCSMSFFTRNDLFSEKHGPAGPFRRMQNGSLLSLKCTYRGMCICFGMIIHIGVWVCQEGKEKRDKPSPSSLRDAGFPEETLFTRTGKYKKLPLSGERMHIVRRRGLSPYWQSVPRPW